MAELFAGGHLRFLEGEWRNDDGDVVDVVEVVRCKECKRRKTDKCPMYYEEDIEWDDDGYIEMDTIFHDNTTDDSFCSYGERSDT